MKKLAITSILLFFFVGVLLSQQIPPDSLYLGQTPPGNTPKIFAPGIVSISGRLEYGISISPDGKEMLFALGAWPDKRTMIIEYKNNHWSSPDTISFSTSRSAEEAIFSPDGQRIYYYAYDAPNTVGGADLCYSEKVDSVWSEPITLGIPLNTTQDEYHPCVVTNGSIYFENVTGKICYSNFQNGNYLERIVLPNIFNDAGMAWGNPFVAPDESYFIFNSARLGGFGNTDLYISYKKNDGTWTNPKNLGNTINTSTAENGSEITDDGLYMTYVSNKDVYWVGTSFIDSLRHTNYNPYVKKLIPNQIDTVGHFFNYTVPDSTFIDDDGNNTLIYSATLSNGNPLPTWLEIDSLTCNFSGTPSIAQTINIKVIATDTAGTSAFTTLRIIINEVSAIDNISGENKEIRIFPNPANGLINISLDSYINQNADIKVCNREGQTILANSFKNKTALDLSAQPKGMYFIIINIDNEMITSKIILQ